MHDDSAPDAGGSMRSSGRGPAAPPDWADAGHPARQGATAAECNGCSATLRPMSRRSSPPGAPGPFDDGEGRNDLRREIAAAAARLIADDGADYGSAKQKAAREVLGDGRAPRNVLPDNDEIDAALREHLALFDDEHDERLARMRAVALQLLERLEAFRPLVTGAVWKGIATAHAPIHVQVFHDNPKDVQFFLIDQRVDFDALTIPHFHGSRRGDEVEAYAFLFSGEPVLLSVYGSDDLRGALLAGAAGQAERGDRRALLSRIDASAD